MNETKITKRILSADPDNNLPESTIYTVHVWTPPDFSVPNGPGFKPQGFWNPVAEFDNEADADAHALVAGTSATVIPGTEHEYLGTESCTVVFHGQTMDAVMIRIESYHQFSRCTCEHDCCGHICGSNYRILSIIPVDHTHSFMAVVYSEFSRNV